MTHRKRRRELDLLRRGQILFCDDAVLDHVARALDDVDLFARKGVLRGSIFERVDGSGHIDLHQRPWSVLAADVADESVVRSGVEKAKSDQFQRLTVDAKQFARPQREQCQGVGRCMAQRDGHDGCAEKRVSGTATGESVCGS